MRSRRSSRLRSMKSTKTTTTAAVPRGPSSGPNTLWSSLGRLLAGSTTSTGTTRDLLADRPEEGRVPVGSGVVPLNSSPRALTVSVALDNGLLPELFSAAMRWEMFSR